MASAKRASLKDPKEHVQLELIYSDDTQFKYWNSSLFNEVYLRKDLPEKYSEMWEEDEAGGFYEFLNNFTNLCKDHEGKEKELKNWSETQTINNWIKYILEDLGWANNCGSRQNPFLEEESFRYENKTYRTDILVVDLPEEKKYISSAKGDKKLTEARQSVLIPVEAKYWNRLEQYRQGDSEEKNKLKKEQDDISRTTSPDQQTLKYMEVLDKDWGILTDGARWRLFNKEISGEDSNRYFEFNLYSLFESIVTAETHQDHEEVKVAAKYFYYFFSKSSFFPEESGVEPFANEVLRYSKKYVNKVEEDLKDRFVKAMNYACNGFYKSAKSNKQITDLDIIRSVSESALFNILFTKSLESKNVLPMNSTEYKKISLSSLIDKIEGFDPDKEESINIRNLERAFKKSNGSSFAYKSNGLELHDKIVRLTKIIHDGQSKKDDFGFEIAGFRESVFSNEEWKLFQTCKLSNEYWVNILFQLGYAESDIKNRKYQQIPYSFFTPRQLGSIYESFLEFQLDQADQDMVFENKQWKKADLNSRKYKNKDMPKVKEGELFFTPDNKERKATGSYYTPDFIVRYIIDETLGPLIAEKKSKDILSLKVCDLAMGSGHFLVGSLNFLTKAYIEALSRESEGDLRITLPEAKRKILDSCIFGLDLNLRAVKLAKMSLWLESAYINNKLEKLDDQMICRNSLLDGVLWKDYPELQENGFDAIVGNPPYIGEKGNEDIFHEVAKTNLGKKYYTRWMDYFYFFFHKALDLCRDDGRIGMITTNYYFNATGAIKLREDLKTRANISKLVNLTKAKLFKEASGQHNVLTFLIKGNSDTGLHDYYEINNPDVSNCKKLVEYLDNKDVKHVHCSTSDIFQGKDFLIQPWALLEGDCSVNDVLKKMEKFKLKLNDICDISPGLFSGADKVSASHLKKYPKVKASKGDPIFIFTSKQMKQLDLDGKDTDKYVRTFFKNSDIERYFVADKLDKKVLYVADTGKPIKLSAKLKKHFEVVKDILIGCKSNFLKNAVAGPIVQKWLDNGNYFVLFLPKKEKYFVEKKIVCPQRSKANIFAYSEKKLYASQDVYFLISNGARQFSLKVLTGILNSKLYYVWLHNRGKRKGEMLEMYQKPLKSVPIPEFSNSDMRTLEKLVDKIIHSNDLSFQNEFEKKFYEIIKLNKNDIEAINNYCISKGVSTSESNDAEAA